MKVAAELLSPSGLPLAADWATVSIAAAPETRVDAAAVVASTAVTVAIANNNVATTTADNEDDDNEDVPIHPPPQPTAAVGSNRV
jgi:hypothetical protein